MTKRTSPYTAAFSDVGLQKLQEDLAHALSNDDGMTAATRIALRGSLDVIEKPIVNAARAAADTVAATVVASGSGLPSWRKLSEVHSRLYVID
jgi:hypothetical protein